MRTRVQDRAKQTREVQATLPGLRRTLGACCLVRMMLLLLSCNTADVSWQPGPTALGLGLQGRARPTSKHESPDGMLRMTWTSAQMAATGTPRKKCRRYAPPLASVGTKQESSPSPSPETIQRTPKSRQT